MISSLIRAFNVNTPAEYPSTYLEFRSSTPMTITPKYTNSGVLLQYKIGGGQWNDIATDVATPSASVIYFRGVATGYKRLCTTTSTTNAWVFTGASDLEVIGSINSLIQDVLGGDVLTIPLATICYSNMFRNCTSLTVAPTLPATTLATSCYSSMFYGCTSLTVAPTLPATTLACYCYRDMFLGCTSLTVAPTLPATTLVYNCYDSMFYGCTSLNTLISLPATTLDSYCYYGMFQGCINIKVSTTKTGIYQKLYRIPKTGTGVTAAEALVDMFYNSGGTFTGTPTINTTYYTANTIV